MGEHMEHQHSETDGSGGTTEFGASASRSRERDSASRHISEDDIRNRAHELYLERGGSGGDPVADWLEAERDLRGRSGGTRTPDDLGGGDDPRDLGSHEDRT